MTVIEYTNYITDNPQRLITITMTCVLQSKGGMQLLLIDNVAAFYWLDKAVKPAAPAPGQSRHNMCVLRSLGRLVTDMHGCRAASAC